MRRSNSIRRQQATYTLPSILTACEKELPLNVFVTINFHHLGLTEKTAAGFNSELRSWAMRWLKRPKIKERRISTPLTIMWVIENANNIGVHWAVHIPVGARASFTRALDKKLRSNYGAFVLNNTVKIKPINNMLGLRKYILKGLDSSFGPLYRIRTCPQGLVIGKRFGVSQNIGPAVVSRMNIKKRRAELLNKHFPTAKVA